jgi:hypothetical protein
MTGRTEAIATCEAGATARVPVDVPRGVARLLVIAPGDPKTAEIDARPWVEVGRLTPEWFGRRMRPNACALIECRVAQSGAGWSSVDLMREKLGAEIAAAGGPVTRRVEWRAVIESGPISRTGWSVATEPGGDGLLRLDGHALAQNDTETLFDPAIKVTPLPPLRSGEHVLEIARSFAAADELQPPWLLGPFKLLNTESGEHAIVVTDESVALGHWAEIGLPSYFGEVIYRAEVEGGAVNDGERVMLEIEWVAHSAEVRVDGVKVGTIFSHPLECELTQYWSPGTRIIDIVVTDAPDNALAGLRGLDEFDTTGAGLAEKPEIVIYGRGRSA